MTQAAKFYSLLLLVIALGLTSCLGGTAIGVSTDPCGGPNQPCCGWPGNSCNGSLSCDRNHVCRGCGYEGGPCCNTRDPATACSNPNLFCNSPPGGPAFVCQACGHIGQPTCVNNSCVTGVAAGGRCVEPSSAEARCNGSTTFLIGLRSRYDHCRYQEYSVRANSLNDAKVCAEGAARLGGWTDPEAVDSAEWEPHALTITSTLTGCDTIQLPAYSIEDAEFCARIRYPSRTIARGSVCP